MITVILLVVLLLLVCLVVGGFVASGRRQRAEAAALRARVDAANQQLAEAHAGDNGWDSAQMEAAARLAWEGAHPADPIEQLHLVEVVDRPGIEADEAVYRVSGRGGHAHDVILARSGDGWVAKR